MIRVRQKDTNKHMGLFMTVPMDRVEAPDSPVLMFTERPKGAPQAIHTWFYPGEPTGEEFVYPRAQAARIARATGRLSSQATTPIEMPVSRKPTGCQP